MDFTALHGYRDFAQLYELALRMANPRQHPDFLKRPLDVLDIQGGNGILGRLLQRDLEDRVIYTNADTDEELLKQTPGRALICDTNFLSWKLKDSRFDYIFCLNHDDHIWLPYFADTENPFSDNYVNLDAIKGLISAIQLLQVAVYLKMGGSYIRGGVITDDNISAFAKYFEENKTGIELKATETLQLSDETARAFASYDIGRAVRYRFNLIEHRYEKVPEEEIQRIIQESMKVYKTLRVALFQRNNEAQDINDTQAKLLQCEKSLGTLLAEIQAMDRFGPM